MNAVWNSYGQLCGCPEIFKKSCKFFCRELDIRVTQTVKSYLFLSSSPSVRRSEHCFGVPSRVADTASV